MCVCACVCVCVGVGVYVHQDKCSNSVPLSVAQDWANSNATRSDLEKSVLYAYYGEEAEFCSGLLFVGWFGLLGFGGPCA